MLATTTLVWYWCAAWRLLSLPRWSFAARAVLFNLFTLGLMFPINVAILPVYFVCAK